MGNSSFFTKVSKGVSGRLNSFFYNPYKKLGLSWLAVKKLKHQSAGRERSFDFFGKKLFFTSPPETYHGLEEIFIGEIYRQKLEKQPYILDCGANIGLSIIYLKHIFPDAIIEAFEPDDTNFGLLQKNIASFGLQNDVLAHKVAIWKENTTLQFTADATMGSKIETGNTDAKTVTVKAVRLKDYLDKKIDFLKIDIEGAEYEVLKDIVPALGNINNLFVEYHGLFEQNAQLVEIFQLIKDAGFKFYIKEAADVYHSPFLKEKKYSNPYDVQLNIFCFK